MVKKRPCRICHRWFQPDRRIGDRQRACPRSECQAERRKRAQAAWRKRHPEYAIAWRIGRWAADEDRDLPRVPPPLPRVPWDLAKDEFGTQGTEILGCLGRLLVWHAKDLMKGQVPGSTGGSPRVLMDVAKDEIGGVPA